MLLFLETGVGTFRKFGPKRRSTRLSPKAVLSHTFQGSQYTAPTGLFTCTDKKENQIFLIYKELQSGAVANSYIYEEGLPNIWGNAQIFLHI
jgi:hypothetical protein